MAVYIAIDLKSFYASVECRERGLDPLGTNLVVADESRTEKTICLAVSPSLKSWGIPGRARLFEVIQKVRQVNAARRKAAPGGKLTASSFYDGEIRRDPTLAVDYITAQPRMALYMDYSARIYSLYLRYVEKEHIHPYSVDEVFIDATEEIAAANMTPRDFAMMLIRDVLRETGITATSGVAPNLYLCKAAMDIVAKKIPPDEDGVRIAELDEAQYRRTLWEHEPLTDFWRVGRHTAQKLAKYGIRTMGDIARASISDEDLLFGIFGVNAELLIDHAWGREPCRMSDIKAYRPKSTSLSNGQVLSAPYPFDKARVVVREMAEALSLELVEKKLTARTLSLQVGYDASDADKAPKTEEDFYGRRVPKSAHGSARLKAPTSSTRAIAREICALFDSIADPSLHVRRMSVAAGELEGESDACREPEQLDMFTDYAAREREEKELARERSMQETLIDLRRRFGANVLVKGMDLTEGATAMERNRQIGGHKA